MPRLHQHFADWLSRVSGRRKERPRRCRRRSPASTSVDNRPMVFRVLDQDEQEMASMRGSLHLSESQRLELNVLDSPFHLWRCSAEPHPGLAFWIGDAEICHSYLGLHPTELGQLKVLEGKRAWTDPAHRRRGFGAALLRAAAVEAPLMTDRGGVTEAAFRLWNSAPGFVRTWWDAHCSTNVPEAEVPEIDRFTLWEPEGKRYQLVLSLP